MENDEKQKIVKEDARKWRFLWISVGLVAVFLIAVWAWSLKSQIFNLDWSKSSEKQMMANLRRDWQEASIMIDKPLAEKKAAEEAVKNKLMEMAGTNASSTGEENTSSTGTNITTTTNQQ